MCCKQVIGLGEKWKWAGLFGLPCTMFHQTPVVMGSCSHLWKPGGQTHCLQASPCMEQAQTWTRWGSPWWDCPEVWTIGHQVICITSGFLKTQIRPEMYTAHVQTDAVVHMQCAFQPCLEPTNETTSSRSETTAFLWVWWWISCVDCFRNQKKSCCSGFVFLPPSFSTPHLDSWAGRSGMYVHVCTPGMFHKFIQVNCEWTVYLRGQIVLVWWSTTQSWFQPITCDNKELSDACIVSDPWRGLCSYLTYLMVSSGAKSLHCLICAEYLLMDQCRFITCEWCHFLPFYALYLTKNTKCSIAFFLYVRYQ